MMVYQTCLLFNIPLSFELAGFVFCGSVCSYNFHWYLTPPVEHPSAKLAWNISNRNLHLYLFIIGLLGSAVFSFLLIEHWFWLGVTAFFTFLYSAPKINYPVFNRLKKIALGKTIFLAFAWTHVTALLPVVMHMKTINHSELVFVINRFFFIYAICILFDYRDVESDKKDGIKSLITYLNDTGIDILFWSSMIVFMITLFFLYGLLPVSTIIVLLVPGIILSLLYYYAKKNFSDHLYYFVLDGLMMLSAPLLLLIKFAR